MTHVPKLRRLVEIFFLVLSVLLIAWAVALRVDIVNSTFGQAINCEACFTGSVILNDLGLISVLSLLLIASLALRNAFVFIPLRLAFLAGIIVYLMDALLLDSFFVRLRLDDLVVYGRHVTLLWRHVMETEMLSFTLIGLLCLVGFLGALSFVPPSDFLRIKVFGIAVVFPLAGIFVHLTVQPSSYIHDWAMRNVAAVNFNVGVTKQYSESFRNTLMAGEAQQDSQVCKRGMDSSPNIVLLILESWSPYQSRLQGGINDWTPKIDEISRKYAWFSRMHAGGFSTNEGLISLFTGLEYVSPQQPFFQIRPFQTAWDTPLRLPEILRDDAGYFTAFLTSGNLSFAQKKAWINTLGFSHVEGHDHPGYDTVEKRHHFDSVNDRVLYQRSVEFIKDLAASSQPFFITIETVSTHHPYRHPQTGERSEEAVFRYMDETVWEFYAALESSGFFDNGILVMVSDHRAMIPITKAEQRAFGQATASLVPLVVASRDTRGMGEIKQRFHQSDLPASFDALTSKTHCHRGPYRNIFRTQATAARCVYHARGDDRDHIDAFCPDGNYLVKLDGDDTRVIEPGNVDDDIARKIVNQINIHRIRGAERTRRLEQSGFFEAESVN